MQTAAAEPVQIRQWTDEELVDRIEAGDRQAFDLLYERYFKRVFAFVQKRLNNRADAEETSQEVFINVFNALPSFRREAPFAAWVLGVARRTVANRFKRKQHPTVPLDDEPETVEMVVPSVQRAATPLEQYECRELIDQLEQAATQHLTSEQRTLFELHHLQHRSITEIARVLHKSEDAVKSNLYRARKLLLAR